MMTKKRVEKLPKGQHKSEFGIKYTAKISSLDRAVSEKRFIPIFTRTTNFEFMGGLLWMSHGRFALG